MVVVVREGDNKGRKIEILRRGGVGEVKRREEGGWEIRVIKARDGWDERSGCMGSSLFFLFHFMEAGGILWDYREKWDLD